MIGTLAKREEAETEVEQGYRAQKEWIEHARAETRSAPKKGFARKAEPGSGVWTRLLTALRLKGS